ncbi:MAG: hypothetical protein ABFS32_15295 [Bacteroidota bacterium]
MKKLFTIFALAGIFLFTAENAKAQATSQVNIGLIGVSLEFPIAEDVSIAPFGATNFDLSYLTAGVKVNYYFDNLFGLPPEFDIYGGANGGYAFGLENQGNDFDLGLQVGFRWFWSEKMGLYLEGGGGKIGATGGLGITIRL